jgi:TPR repeat protein
MIDAKEYFERHISMKQRINGSLTYDCYASMDLPSVEQEAKQGVSGALEELGERYLFGLGVKTDVDKAIVLFQKATDAGNPDALYMLADIHRSEQFGRKNLERYFKLLPLAADRGSWKGLFNMALACYQGKEAHQGYGPDRDHAATIVWSEKCITMCQGLLAEFLAFAHSKELESYFSDVYDTYVRCVCATAKQYYDGDGTEKSLEKALQLVTAGQKFHEDKLTCECPQFSSILSSLQKT